MLKCSPLLLSKILLPRKSDSSGLSSREPLVANKQNGHSIGYNFSRLHNEWHDQPWARFPKGSMITTKIGSGLESGEHFLSQGSGIFAIKDTGPNF